MAEYVFTPSGVRVQSPVELPAPLWAKAPAPDAPPAATTAKRRAAKGTAAKGEGRG